MWNMFASAHGTALASLTDVFHGIAADLLALIPLLRIAHLVLLLLHLLFLLFLKLSVPGSVHLEVVELLLFHLLLQVCLDDGLTLLLLTHHLIDRVDSHLELGK